MDLTVDIARDLVSDAALWPLVRDFLWDFAPQIHKSWIEGLDVEGPKGEGAGIPGLRLSASSSPRVKRFVLSSLGVGPFFHVFPKDDWSRLALLDGATLPEIAKWMGAIACADGLRKVTDGATVRELKSALPGIYPEVFSFTAYFTGLHGDGFVPREGAEAQSVSDRVVSTGFGMLHSILSGLPEPLVSRLELKLPKDLCGSAAPREESALRGIGEGMLPRLLKLKFPEAYRLCC